MNCYRCGVGLTLLNHSPEHIIQRSIGGTIVSWELLCRNCNNVLGTDVDAPFVHFTSHLYKMVLQARETSRTSDSLTGKTESGEEVKFGPNMVRETNVRIALNNGKEIFFTAPPEEAEQKAFKKLLRILGNRDKAKEVIANAQRGQVKLDELVYFSNYDAKQSMTGGPAFWRGIKKIAVGFYLSKGFAQRYVQDVIDQVKQGVPAPRVISTFYYGSTAPVHELGEREVSHIIKLVGDPKIGMLYCYVELFNAHHTLILLNRYYYGPSIDEQFCYDVLAGTELSKIIELPFNNRLLFERHFDYDWHTNSQGQVAYSRTRKVLEDLLREKGHII